MPLPARRRSPRRLKPVLTPERGSAQRDLGKVVVDREPPVLGVCEVWMQRAASVLSTLSLHFFLRFSRNLSTAISLSGRLRRQPYHAASPRIQGHDFYATGRVFCVGHTIRSCGQIIGFVTSHIFTANCCPNRRACQRQTNALRCHR